MKKLLSTLVFASMLAACGPDGSISLRLYVPASTDPNAPNENVFASAAEITVDVFRDGELDRSDTFDATTGSAGIGILPFKGQTRVGITVADSNGNVIGRGSSPALDLEQSDDGGTLSILVGRANTFFPTTDSNTGSASTMAQKRVGLSATEFGNGLVLLAGGSELNNQGQVIAQTIRDDLEVYDPKTGTFAALTAKFQNPRAFHSATKLPDGRIVFVGGLSRLSNGSISTLATAEIFDPATCGVPFNAAQCTLSVVGDGATRLNQERAGHTATLLKSGAILMVGGFRQTASATQEFLKTAETLSVTPDSNSGAFQAAGQMPENRGLHTANLLPDGTSVLITGGRDATTVFNSMLIFKENVGFVPAATMTIGRFSHTVTPIAEGLFLIVGGFTQLNNSVGSTPTTFLDVVDSQGQMLSPSTPLGIAPTGAVAEQIAQPLEDGRVLIAGGSLSNGTSSEKSFVARFFRSGDPNTGIPALDLTPTLQGMETPRARATAIAHSSGNVIIFGGTQTQGNSFASISSAEMFIGDIF